MTSVTTKSSTGRRTFGLPLTSTFLGSMKKNQTSAVDSAVETRPGRRPPIQELRKTAGKNMNHTNGEIHDHRDSWTARATNGGSSAK